MKTTREHLVLLVEDNAEDEELALRALRRSGVQSRVVVVRDGEEALHFLFGEGAYGDRSSGPLPDLVLLDLKLPKLSGHEVLQKIRGDQRTEVLPIVILTSSSEYEDVRQSYKKGANSYIRKPVDSDQFANAVRQLGLYWLTLNEPSS